MITPSSNQLIRNTTQNIMGNGLLIHHFLYKNWTGNSDIQNKKMRTLCSLSFTAFSASSFSCLYLSLGSHLPAGGWGNHASAMLHHARKRLFAEYCCLVRHKYGKSYSLFYAESVTKKTNLLLSALLLRNISCRMQLHSMSLYISNFILSSVQCNLCYILHIDTKFTLFQCFK